MPVTRVLELSERSLNQTIIEILQQVGANILERKKRHKISTKKQMI